MSRVIHFEIAVDDADRARKFYESVFSWKFNKWDGPFEYWLIETGDKSEPGIDGALVERKEAKADVQNTVNVSDIDEFMEKVKSNGGEVITEKSTVPGVGYHAYCKDTEGNVFGIMQHDENAK